MVLGGCYALERIVDEVSLDERRLHAEVGGHHVAPLKANKIQRALSLASFEMGLYL